MGYTISKVAERTGLTISTLRYYDKEGLLPFVDRTAGGANQISDERLIAYKHGKITTIQVQNIEKNLETIISKFEEMKKDLLFILSESAE